jgi:hypothetical protein
MEREGVSYNALDKALPDDTFSSFILSFLGTRERRGFDFA